jgi:hypothetical protein
MEGRAPTGGCCRRSESPPPRVMPAAELLAEALEAAGGEQRWRSARRIAARTRIGGLLPRTRVPGNRFADCLIRVEVDRQHTVLDPYPEPGLRGVLDGDEVRIETGAGAVVATRRDPRSRFFGLSGLRRNLRWDRLDASYFTGYAMWNYLTAPLLLARPEIELSEGTPWGGEGAEWRRLHARFPPGLQTHSPEQTFFLDERGRQVRHDYTAEVVAARARAAHYCADHREFDGLLFPTRRWVLPRRRDLRSRPGPTLVWIEIDHVDVEFG